jgi:hypothetical protein
MSQSSQFIPLLLIFGFQFGIFILIIVFYFRNVLGKSMKSMTGPDGRAYFFGKRKYGKYGSKYALSIGVPVQNGFVFSIWRKTFWHRFLESLGLAQGVPSGDQSFDAAYYCMADDEQRLKALLGTAFVNVVRETFDASKARDIECAGGKIWFNTKPVNFLAGASPRVETLMSSQRFTTVMESRFGAEQLQKFKVGLEAKRGAFDMDEQGFVTQAAKLAQEVGKLDAPAASQFYAAGFPPSRATTVFRIIHVVLLVISIAALLTLIGRSEDLINMQEFFLKVAGIAPFVILAWLGLLIFIFGRTSWFPPVLSSFLLSGVAALALLTAFAVREVNIDLDQAPPEVKSLQLLSKHCSLYCTTGGKHATTQTYPLSDQQCSVEEAGITMASYKARDYKCHHSAHFNYNLYFPWPAERTDGKKEMYKVSMNAASYERAQAGEPFAFPLHKGYLGLAWIRKSEIRPE